MSKKRRWHIRHGLIGCMILYACHLAANAQAIRVSKVTTKPNLTCVACSLTVTASPSSVNFSLVQGGVSTASNPISITTTLVGIPVLSSLSLYGYFTTASAALSDGINSADVIPTSSVWGAVNSTTSYTQFTQSGMLGTPGATLLLYSTTSLPPGLGCTPTLASCRTDTLSLRINLTNQTGLPAGTYTGTLILQAEAL